MPAFVVKRQHLLLTLLCLPLVGHGETSTCYGTTANGRLENGVQLPESGANYIGYSTIARFAGRTYVHSVVRDVIVAAYADLAREQRQKVYKYAETGFDEGGEFWPHKTHANGLSVDFMTPVIDASGTSVHLPTHPLNKFGYDIEFDANGHYDGVTIDYEAMAAHIVALDRQAKRHGHGLWRVIFDPELQPNLYEAANGRYADYLRANVTFSEKRSWVRHDEHYHIDFSVACKSE